MRKHSVYFEAALVWGAAIAMLVVAICATGCGSSAPAADHDYRATAAAILATEDGGAAPAPSPTPSPSGKCENCNGKGRLGDGTVSVPCPECGGDGIKSEPPTTADTTADMPDDPNAEAKPCGNPNCTCDVCSGDCECGMLAPNQRAALLGENKALKDELQLARAEAYAPVKVNGDWYCTKNGQTLRYDAVRCYGPDRPCDYAWVPVSEIPKPQASVLRSYAPRASPSCESGNCGRASRRGIFRW